MRGVNLAYWRREFYATLRKNQTPFIAVLKTLPCSARISKRDSFLSSSNARLVIPHDSIFNTITVYSVGYSRRQACIFSYVIV